jgi:hypothetical protein
MRPIEGSTMLKMLLILVLLPTAAWAEPQEIGNEALGQRWLGEQYLDTLGWKAAAPGDLNGDGLSDFVVSSPQDLGPATFDSVLRIYFGQAGGPPQSGDADWSGVEIADPKVSGDAVFEFAVVPDLSGDGIADILVAEPFAGDNGKVLLYAGSDGEWPSELAPQQAVAQWNGYTEADPWETSLAPQTRPSHIASGDMNGDGDPDLIVGSQGHRKVWIDLSDGAFSGENRIQDADYSFVRCAGTEVVPTRNESQFARDLAVGDFDDDGIDDLVVSAPNCVDGEGRVFVWYGGPGLNPEAPDLVLSGGDRLGGDLNVADLNGDGRDDLFVQELRSGSNANKSNLWIYLGATTGLALTPDVTISGGAPDVRFGESITLLRDVSNPADNLPELVVGAPETANEGLGQGAVYIFEGKTDWTGDWSTDDAWYVAYGAHRDAWFGTAVAALDDFDGDGRPEIVIGEPNYTDGDAENDYRRGRIYLVDALPDRDEDGDGVGTIAGDCDDTDDSISPNAQEACDDDIDNDCDREVDEGCGDDDDDSTASDDDDSLYVPADDDDLSGGCDCGSSVAANDLEPGWAMLGLTVLAWRRRRFSVGA